MYRVRILKRAVRQLAGLDKPIGRRIREIYRKR
jgi:mRNA-degrading endonuclease RelE of RelBE toxin-antitoxin system